MIHQGYVAEDPDAETDLFGSYEALNSDNSALATTRKDAKIDEEVKDAQVTYDEVLRFFRYLHRFVHANRESWNAPGMKVSLCLHGIPTLEQLFVFGASRVDHWQEQLELDESVYVGQDVPKEKRDEYRNMFNHHPWSEFLSLVIRFLGSENMIGIMSPWAKKEDRHVSCFSNNCWKCFTDPI